MRVITFIRRVWSGETGGVASAAALIGVASLMSRVLGLVRDRLLASQFGAGLELDAYYAAFRLPDVLYNLLIVGALSAGFIPLFAELKERQGMTAALKFTSQVLSVLGVMLLVACSAGIIAAPFIVPLLAPGFEPAKQLLTTGLTRVMFLSPLFLGISAIMGGVLQSTKRFFAFAFAPIFYNVGIILGILCLAPVFGLVGLAWGVVLGAVAHCFVQYLAVRPLGTLSFPIPSLAVPTVRRMFALMIPRTAGLAVAQLNLVIILFFASTLEQGSVAVLNLAGNLQSVPLGLIGVSFAVAAFPVLAEAVGSKRSDVFEDTVLSVTRKMLYFILPLCVLFLLLHAQIVRVVLGNGQFDWEDTRKTYQVFALLTLALPAQALTQLFARAFYALQHVWTPFVIGATSELVTVLVAWTTYRTLDVNGLAWAVVAGALVNVILLVVLLTKGRVRTWLASSQRQFVWVLLMALFAQVLTMLTIKRVFMLVVPILDRIWLVLLQGVVAGVLGGAVFLAVTIYYRLPEAELVRVLKKRLISRCLRGSVTE